MPNPHDEIPALKAAILALLDRVEWLERGEAEMRARIEALEARERQRDAAAWRQRRLAPSTWRASQ